MPLFSLPFRVVFVSFYSLVRFIRDAFFLIRLAHSHTQQFELYFTFQFLFTLGSLFRHYKFIAILSFFRPPFHSFSFAISHSCNVHSIQFDSANDGGDGDNDNDKNNNDTMATKRMPLFTVSTEMYENSLGKSEVKYRNLQRNDFIVEKEIF